jgi:hypothetical protein
MKHSAEGSQVWTRVPDSWRLVDLLEDLELQPQPVAIRLGGGVGGGGRPSVEDVVSSLGVPGGVACGWMWRMPGGGSVRS